VNGLCDIQQTNGYCVLYQILEQLALEKTSLENEMKERVEKLKEKFKEEEQERSRELEMKHANALEQLKQRLIAKHKQVIMLFLVSMYTASLNI
jgi:D-ribose pyranose/furanose isomerase RbsD